MEWLIGVEPAEILSVRALVHRWPFVLGCAFARIPPPLSTAPEYVQSGGMGTATKTL